MRKQKSPKQRSKEKAWKLFSLYIRRKYADKQGYVNCVTCGTIKHYKEMQAGHFISGRCNSILFDERGVYPQCYGCNVGRGGNHVEYFIFMEKEQGRDAIDELRVLKNKPLKRTIYDYNELIEKYTDALVGLDVKDGLI